MASRIPILASKTQGPLEILNSETGYFTEQQSAAVLANDILSAIGSKERKSKAVKALERFHINYSTSAVVAQYLALYERLLKS
jgi:glycosyltransferase involved in cell wall biosynthesis